MRRALLIPAFATLMLFLPASPGGANGGSVFVFDGEFVVPGTEAQASTVVWLGEQGLKALEKGPFYAYLVPVGTWIDPPRVPADAVRLGVIDFAPARGQKSVAGLSFTVPDVPTDVYSLAYCNDPCTEAAVGDLYGAAIWIADDAEEAALLRDRESAASRADDAERLVRHRERQIDKLEEALRTAESSTTDQRIAELQAQLQAARQRPAGTDAGMLPWLVGTGALGVSFLLGRARRRPSMAASSAGTGAPVVRELEPV